MQLTFDIANSLFPYSLFDHLNLLIKCFYLFLFLIQFSKLESITNHYN